MNLTKEQILEAISKMNMIEVIELTEMLEKKFNISSTNQNLEPIDKSQQKKDETKSEFNVFLTKIGSNRVSVIKAVRSITSLGLKESKEKVESTPTIIKESIPIEEAQKIKSLLEEAGASVEIK